MGFTPKTFTQILNTIMTLFIGQTPNATDFNTGSVARSLMEAVASEQERIYMQILESTGDAIDSSAYMSFGFTLLAGTAAYGVLTLTRTGGYAPDISIPTSTQFRVPNTNKVYSTTSNYLWTGGAGSTTQAISVTCSTTGTFGNTPANSVTQQVAPIIGIASVTNASAYFTGTDTETADQRRQRFASYVASLPRSTKSACEFGAKTAKLVDGTGYTTEQAQKAHAFEVSTTTATAVGAPGSVVITPADMTGIVAGSNLLVDSGAQQESINVASVTSTTFTATFGKTHSGTWVIVAFGEAMLVIHNGVGATSGLATSAALVTQTQTIIDGTATVPGYRSAGVTIRVVAATESDQVIKVVVTSLFDGYTLALIRGNAIAAIQGLVNALDIGETLRLADIFQVVRNVPGVRDCTISLPATNITATNRTLIVSSSISVSQFALSTALDVNIT